jgi:hydroxyacylglutathione hydrolase
MYFQQIYETGLAHASYIVGCQATGTCAVIDPKRDIDTYLEITKKERLRITHILETHIHADFLSGSRELAERTGAKMYLSDEGGEEWQYAFDHQGIKDGDTFMVGNIKFDVMHTPGHTPEHVSFLVTDTPASDQPIMMFTGDFVFVGDVGRPDLLEKAAGQTGTMEIGARQLWESLKRFKALPDHIQVHPAHGAGSACGKALGAIPSSTVGYEKIVNWALRHTNEEAFVKDLLSGQPEPPKYFAMMKLLNKVDRPLLTSVPTMKELTTAELNDAIKNGLKVIDTRSKVSFAGGHIPNTINITNNKSFSNWAGWLIDYEAPFLVIAPQEQTDDIMRKLMRIGLDNVAGYYPSVTDWQEEGHDLATLPQIELEELKARHTDADVVVIDIRGESEYLEGHIPGAWNIHTGHLPDYVNEIPKDKVVVISCESGARSSIGASVLQRLGLRNIVNFSQGFSGWKSSGAPVEMEPNTFIAAGDAENVH